MLTISGCRETQADIYVYGIGVAHSLAGSRPTGQLTLRAGTIKGRAQASSQAVPGWRVASADAARSGSDRMKKSDIVERVAGQTGITKQAADAAVAAVFASIAEALVRGEDIAVAGFGRFARTERPAREGRNPRTGESIAIGPSSGVSFKAGKALKDALN